MMSLAPSMYAYESIEAALVSRVRVRVCYASEDLRVSPLWNLMPSAKRHE